jgi:hypothetical protein
LWMCKKTTIKEKKNVTKKLQKEKERERGC